MLSEEVFFIGVQNPITLSDQSEPEPDLFVARGAMEDFESHPTPEQLLLVIEVADSSLEYDRNVKKPTYAVAGIPEYWIVNVYEKKIERYTNPQVDEVKYASKDILGSGDQITSKNLGKFAINDLLI